MAKLLRTRTEYDIPHMRELQLVMGRTYARRQTQRKRGFALGLGTFLTLAGVWQLVNQGFSVPAVVCAVPGAVLLLWGIFFYTVTAWTAQKAMGKRWVYNDFALEKENLMVYLESEGVRHPYSDCIDLLEAELCLYVIGKDGSGLMLDKANVKGGTADDLRAQLEERCGHKARWAGGRRGARAAGTK